ncbi:MAG: serine/threonine-protein phosphatase [Clostridiales bacterium]|nr:serine/threonine-protein phosphatase [Clostridiales bacterium]
MGEHITRVLYGTRQLPFWLRASAASIAGTRPYQEDSLMYRIFEDGILGVVCDGMGGLAHGEISSTCAVEKLSEYFNENERTEEVIEPYMERALYELDAQVASLKNASGRPLKGGTTVVAVFIREGRMTYASAGDSMIYLVRSGECREVVRKHNYGLLLDKQMEEGLISREEYEEELSRGEALISYLGMDGLRMVDCGSLILEEGDRIVLCSDGLYKGLTMERIGALAAEQTEEEFEQTALSMLAEILKGPPQNLDNISILCFSYGRENNEIQENL